jgi:hypothetical protein
MRKCTGVVVVTMVWVVLAGCEPTGGAGSTGTPYYDYDRIGEDAVKGMDTTGLDGL